MVVLEGVEHGSTLLLLRGKTSEVMRFVLDVEGQVISVSASIGIALFPQHSHEPSTLLKLADQAMYAAKRKGKNTFAFYAPPTAQAQVTQAL